MFCGGSQDSTWGIVAREGTELGAYLHESQGGSKRSRSSLLASYVRVLVSIHMSLFSSMYSSTSLTGLAGTPASLGPSVNALFYTSFLFSSTIDQVAANYASPLIVEGAHAPETSPILVRLALRHIYRIVIPTVTALIIVSPWLLRAFGAGYASAAPLLDMLLIACLPKAVSTVYYAYCRVQRRTHRSAIMQAYVCTATLSGVALVAHSHGLIGVGLVVVAVQSSAGAASWWALRRHVHRFGGQNNKQGRHRRQHGVNTEAETARLSVTGR